VKDVSDLSLRKRIGLAATVVVALHIVLSLVFTLTPNAAQHAGLVGLMYKRLMLIGPFFNESRIKTSPHLYIRTYENGRWSSARDFANENYVFFQSHPWRQDMLRMNYFERYISKKVGQRNKPLELGELNESGSFRELNQFVLREYIPHSIDSISLVYGLNRYFPETNTSGFDTTFVYTYNPAEIGPARKSY
jgi:hypothetical protein